MKGLSERAEGDSSRQRGEERAKSGNENRAWQMGTLARLRKCTEVSMVAKQNRKVKGDETREPKREEHCSVPALR